jgi:hypothetical protein
VLDNPGAAVYLASAVLVAASSTIALRLAASRPLRLGLAFAAITVLLWAIELWTGNWTTRNSVTDLVYRLSAFGAVAAPAVGGYAAADRAGGRLGDGVAVGLVSGVIGGLFVCGVAAVSSVLVDVLGSPDAPTLAEFQRSGRLRSRRLKRRTAHNGGSARTQGDGAGRSAQRGTSAAATGHGGRSPLPRTSTLFTRRSSE